MFHLAAQTIVPTANPRPASTFETNIRGTWTVLEACRRHGAERVVVASSDKAYGPHRELPYREDHRAPADVPLRRLQGRHRPARPLLLAHLAAAGRGDAVREPVRRRRHQRSRLVPEAVDRRARRPLPGRPLRRVPGARLPLRRGRRRGVSGDRGGARRGARVAARRSTPAAAGHTACSTSSS